MKWAVVLPVAAALSGCLGLGGLPDKEEIKVTAPAGISAPLNARVLLHVSKEDMERKLLVESHYFSAPKEGTTKEGEAMERATRGVLAQAFQSVATNQPEIKPQLIVRPMGSAKFSRYDNMLKVGCALDLFDGAGARLGSFSARFDPDKSVTQDSIETVYMLCMKKAADDMLRSSAIARLAKSGVADPDPAASAAFLRSLGYRVGR
ncbi:MAG: hypothetical protein ACM31L_11115 [Actinomycetota bacterium]